MSRSRSPQRPSLDSRSYRDRRDASGQDQRHLEAAQRREPLRDVYEVMDTLDRRNVREFLRNGTVTSLQDVYGTHYEVTPDGGVTRVWATCRSPNGGYGARAMNLILTRELSQKKPGELEVTVRKISAFPPRIEDDGIWDGYDDGSFEHNSLASRPPRPPAPPPPGPHPDETCDACGIVGHGVQICVMRSEEGDLPACPFCGLYNRHLPEDCELRSNFTDDALWQLFVVNRCGKSQIRTRDHSLMWPNIVALRLYAYPNEMHLKRYPLSREFARLENPDFHRKHDYRDDDWGLPTDDRTFDRDEILADAGLRVP